MPENSSAEGQLKDLSYQGPKFGSILKLSYGLNRSNNRNHYVQFQAREYTPETMMGTGTATEPTNDPRNLVVTRPPMRNTVGTISLYLPAQINVSQKSNYGEPEIGGAISAGFNAMKSTAGEKGFIDSAKAMIGSLKEAGGAGATKAVGALGDGLATGASAAIAISSGITTNNSTELMFEGVDRRSFSFTFRMIPHNAQEAIDIQQIVREFRFHMAPHVPSGKQFGQQLVAPSTFNITYSHERELHRISESVLESVDVKYGGERPQFYHDNRPTETEITLQFKELEIITKRRIAEGF